MTYQPTDRVLVQGTVLLSNANTLARVAQHYSNSERYRVKLNTGATINISSKYIRFVGRRDRAW